MQGICDCLAKLMKEKHGLDVDPQTDIAICCGQTEAFAAAVFASMFFYSFEALESSKVQFCLFAYMNLCDIYCFEQQSIRVMKFCCLTLHMRHMKPASEWLEEFQ